MLVRLRETGSIVQESQEADTENSIERRAMIVYAGTFESMDGEVVVSPAHLSSLVKSHNTLIGRVKRLASGETPLKNYPPVQADHSTSAWDTIGRVIGDLELGEHETDDGKMVPAVFGNVRFLGKDNVERVKDGRWTHLSIGADFEKSKLAELTVTPFPAAAGASLLRLGDQKNREKTGMDRAKLKKYLMDCKKMSEEDSEKELDKLSAEDKKEDLDKLSAEESEYASKLSMEIEEEDKKAKEEKLAAARTELTRLSTDFRSSSENARLAATKGRIISRLSKLRAQAKITPAEIKKMDMTKLAASSSEAIEAVLASYESREPVLPVGQLGSTKAQSLSEHQAKTRMSRLEAETRANMPLLARMDQGKRLSEVPGGAGSPPPVVDASPSPPDLSSYEADYGHICSMIDQGNAIGAKDALKKLLEKVAVGASTDDFTESNTLETENQLSALAASVEKMQTQFDSLSKLASSIVNSSAPIIRLASGEPWGLRWRENGVVKQKDFKTEAERDKFFESLEKKDSFEGIESYSDPRN